MQCAAERALRVACQFGEAESFRSSDGLDYCRWHLPDYDKFNWDDARKESLLKAVVERATTLGRTEHGVDFTGLVCPPGLRISNLADITSATFRAAVFIGDVELSDISVSGRLSFEQAKIGGKLRLQRMNVGQLWFRAATCDEVATLNACNVAKALNFQSAKFEAEAYFSECTFRADALFHDAAFNGNCQFQNVVFADIAYFNQVEFQKAARFVGAKFLSNSYFDRGKFLKGCQFNDAEFGGPAIFKFVTFRDNVSFARAKFSKAAIFDCEVDDEQSAVPVSTWERAIFSGPTSFQNRKFSTKGDFSGCRFEKAPSFHGSVLHEAMIFPEEVAFAERKGDEAAQAYRTLRLAMEKISSRIEAGRFYALEHESRRNTPGRLSRFDRCLSFGYSILSNYGRSGSRPLIWLLATLVAFGFFYAWVTSPVLVGDIDSDRIGSGLDLSMQQVAQPFAIWRDVGKIHSGAWPSRWIALLCTFQSVVSIALLSLSLFAIRWRFKRE